MAEPSTTTAPFHLAAHDGDVARVVARRFLLFVSVLVFLVHDDEAERFDRRKNRRARADDDARAALPNLVPFIVPFAGGQMAECKTATSVCNCPELKRALNRSTVCGVSEISGTSTMAPLPCSSAWAMACK